MIASDVKTVIHREASFARFALDGVILTGIVKSHLAQTPVIREGLEFWRAAFDRSTRSRPASPQVTPFKGEKDVACGHGLGHGRHGRKGRDQGMHHPILNCDVLAVHPIARARPIGKRAHRMACEVQPLKIDRGVDALHRLVHEALDPQVPRAAVHRQRELRGGIAAVGRDVEPVDLARPVLPCVSVSSSCIWPGPYCTNSNHGLRISLGVSSTVTANSRSNS